MKKLLMVMAASMMLAACGSGGSSPNSNPPVATPTPTHYSLKLHWEPASQAGLAAALRRPETSRVTMDTLTGTVIVQSPTGGQSPFDAGGGSPAYVTVSVSPVPSPGAVVDFTTTSSAVSVEATPNPPYPNPSASPAVILIGKTNAKDQSGTISATVNGVTTTNNLWAILSLALVAPHNGGSPVLPDAVGFTFDANCTAVPQAMTTGSDVYITGPENATVYFPNGGVALAHGPDVSTLSASQWTNSETSITLDAFGAAFDDVVLFKTSDGRVVFIEGSMYGGSNPMAAGAYFEGGYGCLS